MIRTAFDDFLRFIFFKPTRGDMAKHWPLYLAIGISITWLVGFGRTWDYSEAPFLIRTGLTSILYTLVLSAFIWVIGAALRPQHWSYRNVLLMVTMTAAPGLIYAIPVERLMPADEARAVNMIFLAVVAVWRMALYHSFLRNVAKLPTLATLVAWLLPPTIIVSVLSVFGVLMAIARSMGGDRAEAAPGEISAEAIMFIAMTSWTALPILLVMFIALAIRRFNPVGSNPLQH